MWIMLWISVTDRIAKRDSKISKGQCPLYTKSNHGISGELALKIS